MAGKEKYFISDKAEKFCQDKSKNKFFEYIFKNHFKDIILLEFFIINLVIFDKKSIKENFLSIPNRDFKTVLSFLAKQQFFQFVPIGLCTLFWIFFLCYR
ncbi:MAG: hypothetical protein BGO07_00025 [Alphaproteobacteria bacterium 40-19]|mgnify:CR=1 FL=1|nr:MAG: hypothetical protein BGO07_00025 [Alphaproteobacteria bacterium 40-19]